MIITFLFLLFMSYIKADATSSFFDLASPTNRLSYILNNDTIISNKNKLSTFFSFEQAMHNNKIIKTLFGKQTQNKTISISGSQASQRNPHDLLADYFYLPNNFISSIKIEPHIDTYYTGLILRQSLDQAQNRFFINLFIPISYRKTHMNLIETIKPQSYNNHDIGYFTPDDSFTAQRCLKSAKDYFYGKSMTQINQSDGFENTVFHPLKYSKIKESRDLQSSIGCKISLDYEAYQYENFLFTVSIHSNLPVGLKPKGDYLLEGAMGTSPYWTLGGGIATQVEIFKTNSCIFLLDGYIQIEHQFPVKMYRVFDLVDKPLSRYMLAEKLGPANNNDQLFIGQTAAQYQFKKEFCPIANLTRLPVNVSRSIICDGAIAGLVNINPLVMKIGSTFAISSHEKIDIEPNTIFANNTTWAIKGDSQVYGFTQDSDPISLSVSQKNATIFNGTNYPQKGNPSVAQKITARQNTFIDNKGLANQNGIFLLYDPNITPNFSNSINGSLPPLFIKEQDLSLDASQIQYAECSLFGSLTYTVSNTIDNWQPSFSVGSNLIFGLQGSGNCHTRCGYQAWNIWLQASLSY